jgi:ABC-type molybdenum transport system ATPase subunit/photorepair protein PhrA
MNFNIQLSNWVIGGGGGGGKSTFLNICVTFLSLNRYPEGSVFDNDLLK